MNTLSAPTVTLTATTGNTGWTVIGYLGEFTDPRYGTFRLTREMVQSWQKNLAAVTGEPRVSVDYDHSSDAPGGVQRAAGWITAIRLSGDRVEAQIRWTPAAVEAIEDGEYQYFSPTFADRYKTDQGVDVGPTLIGGALTNRPFLRSKGSMLVTLSQHEVAALEQRVKALCASPPPIYDTVRTRDVVAGAVKLTDPDSGRPAEHPVDAGRAELDHAVRRRQAQAGGSYTDALDWVTEQHQAGLTTLSAAAGEGLGEPGLGWRDRSDVPDPADSAVFRDAEQYAASRRDPTGNPDPGSGAEQAAAGGRGVGRSEALDRRHDAIVRLAQATGETYEQCVQRLGDMVDG